MTDPYWGHTVVPGGGDADQANKEDYEPQSISVTYDHTFSPSKLNEVQFGYLLYPENLYSLLNNTDYSTKYGVGNVDVPGYSATVGYPQIFLADGYLAGGSTYKPYHVKDQNYQIGDSFTWTKGRHELKFGGDVRLLNSHPDFSLFPTGFDYFESFGYAETSNFYYNYIPGAYNWAGGSDLADLVLGLPTDVYIGLQLTQPHTNSWNLDYYGEDSFRVTPRLTLNYGLRYEYQNPWTEQNNYMSNYSIASNTILLAGRGGASRSLMTARKDDISPRFGFDYRFTPTTVLRGGEAIFYSPENDGREDILTENAPFAEQAAYTNWVYNGPSGGPTAPWQYVLDTGVARSTAINIPSSGVIVPSTLPNGNLETTYAINPKMKTGTNGSFSLTVQQEITKNTSFEIGWVGSIARHLSYEIGDINADPNNTANNFNNRLTTSLGNIQYLTDSGISKYNAMEVKVTKQTSRNTAFLLSYTWSHSLDNGPAPFDLGHVNNDSPQNPYNLKSEYASGDFDERNNLVFSGEFIAALRQEPALGLLVGPGGQRDSRRMALQPDLHCPFGHAGEHRPGHQPGLHPAWPAPRCYREPEYPARPAQLPPLVQHVGVQRALEYWRHLVPPRQCGPQPGDRPRLCEPRFFAGQGFQVRRALYARHPPGSLQYIEYCSPGRSRSGLQQRHIRPDQQRAGRF